MQALESGKPKKGARVLIHAASGGVGIALVQLAKILYGAHVVGTTGPKNIDFVKVGAPTLRVRLDGNTLPAREASLELQILC